MADEKDIAAESEGGGKKKLIIIIGIAVVLLLSAGAAAFFLLGGGSADEGEAAQEGQAAAVEEGDPVYHKLDPAFIVTLPPGGPAGMAQIAIEVMTRNPEVVDTLSANDPMIRHHVLNLLEGQSAEALLTLDGKQALQAAIHEFLNGKLQELQAPGEIKGVYFTQFVLQ